MKNQFNSAKIVLTTTVGVRLAEMLPVLRAVRKSRDYDSDESLAFVSNALTQSAAELLDNPREDLGFLMSRGFTQTPQDVDKARLPTKGVDLSICLDNPQIFDSDKSRALIETVNMLLHGTPWGGNLRGDDDATPVSERWRVSWCVVEPGLLPDTVETLFKDGRNPGSLENRFLYYIGRADVESIVRRLISHIDNPQRTAQEIARAYKVEEANQHLAEDKRVPFRFSLS